MNRRRIILLIALAAAVMVFAERGRVNSSLDRREQPEISQPNPTPQKVTNFPKYPGAVFIKQEKDGYISTYTWHTEDDFNQVNSWYMQDKSDSGWKCGSSAGYYYASKEASVLLACQKDYSTYDLSIAAYTLKTEIKLIVKNGEWDQDLESQKYECPAGNWENCQPVLSPKEQRECSREALLWKGANCPDFKGAVY